MGDLKVKYQKLLDYLKGLESVAVAFSGGVDSTFLLAAAMSLSSFCVVTNALRLNFFKMHDASKDKKIKNSVVLENIQVQNTTKQEEITMKKTMKIEGMMCGHCEATVKKALESIDGVTEAVVSHESGTAVVSMTTEISDEVLTQTVEDKDYKVTGIE